MNPKKKKVLFLTQSFIRFRGDISSAYLHVLAKKIFDLGYDVEVLSPHEKDLLFYEKVENIPIHRFRYGSDGWERLAYQGVMDQLVRKSLINKLIFLLFLISYFWNAIKLAKKPEVKLIHAHWWIPTGLVATLVSMMYGKPLVITTHGTDIRILKPYGISHMLGSFVFKRVSHVTVVSNFLKKKLISVIPIPPSQVTVRPMPVNIEQFGPPERKRKNAKDRKTILCVARYTKQKRLDTLIDALGLLKAEGMEVNAILIGEGDEEGSLKKLIGEKNLSSQVTFLPLMPQDELNRYYQKSDLVVLPSVDEGFGLVLVEAQMCRIPVIGADSGGIPDIIVNEKTGLLFPPGDSTSLAKCIKRIFDDEGLASELISNAYQEARTRFSPDSTAKTFVGIYDTLTR
ncbi:MAG: glycosyltransferase family 4 protein [Candidatus Zixiibacteriota bacterium]